MSAPADSAASPPLLCRIVDGVAELTLNRPEASNAVDLPAARWWAATLESLGRDSAVRAVVVLGAGKRFCAGGDVRAMADADDRGGYVTDLAGTMDRVLVALGELDVPVVAGVHGAVAGAGLGLMLACDLVLAGAGTRFTAGYPGVGLSPDCGVSYHLPRAVGQQRALEFLLTGRVLTAEEALDWGLISRIEPDEAVQDRARELARQLAAGPSAALGASRRLVRAGWSLSRAAAGERETTVIGDLARSPDAEKLLRQFTSR